MPGTRSTRRASKARVEARGVAHADHSLLIIGLHTKFVLDAVFQPLPTLDSALISSFAS